MADEFEDDFEEQEEELEEAPRRRVKRAARFPWKRVRSSNVHSISYDENEAVLWVKFLDGSIYRYFDVEPEIWEAFVVAPSKGKFIWKYIRDVYEYERTN